MLPSETELLERDIQNERRARAKARKERFADEPVRCAVRKKWVDLVHDV